MHKQILYFSDCALTTYQVQGKRLSNFYTFTLDEAGQTELANYLQQDLKNPVYWLVDSTQEEYQNTLIPHVSGKDRNILLKHRMQRMFEDTEYTYAEVQRRETQGRGDDKVLFTALNNPTELKPWLAILMRHKIPLAGMYSMPLLSQMLLRYFSRSDYHLLIAHNPPVNTQAPYALRQNFFFKQKLQLSRLVPLHDTVPLDYAIAVVSQCTNTLRYLSTARLLSHTTRVAVTFIVPPTIRPVVLQHLQQYGIPNAEVTLLDTDMLAKRLGIQAPINTPLYLHHFVSPHLSSMGSQNHYAKLKETRYFWHQRINQALYWTAGLVFSAGLLIAAVGLWGSLQHIQAGLTDQQQMVKQQRELNSLRQNLPEFKVDIIYLRNIVDIGRFLNTRDLQPHRSWQVLSEVLIRHPAIQIEKLTWSHVNDRPTIFKNRLNFDSDSDSTISAPQARKFFEALQIIGTIDAPRQNYRSNDRIFNRFVEALKTRTYSDWRVEILLAPYQDNPNPSLGTPSFEIELQVIHTPTL